MVINPDLAAAQEIARILAFPAAFSVEPFARGRIDMIGFQVMESDTICGIPLSQAHRLRQAEVLICAAEHQGEYIIPDGSFTPSAGDRVYMLGAKPELQRMLKEMGRTWQKVKRCPCWAAAAAPCIWRGSCRRPTPASASWKWIRTSACACRPSCPTCW